MKGISDNSTDFDEHIGHELGGEVGVAERLQTPGEVELVQRVEGFARS